MHDPTNSRGLTFFFYKNLFWFFVGVIMVKTNKEFIMKFNYVPGRDLDFRLEYFIGKCKHRKNRSDYSIITYIVGNFYYQ